MLASRPTRPADLSRAGVLPPAARALPFYSFSFPDLTCFCVVLLRPLHLFTSAHAACGFSGVRLPPAAPRHGGGPTGRLRDLHGGDRASARRYVRKAKAARRTGARIVQSGALCAFICEFSPPLYLREFNWFLCVLAYGMSRAGKSHLWLTGLLILTYECTKWLAIKVPYPGSFIPATVVCTSQLTLNFDRISVHSVGGRCPLCDTRRILLHISWTPLLVLFLHGHEYTPCGLHSAPGLQPHLACEPF